MSLNAWNLQKIINISSSLEVLQGSFDAAQCMEFTIDYKHLLVLGAAPKIARCRSMREICNRSLTFTRPWSCSEVLRESFDVAQCVRFTIDYDLIIHKTLRG